MSSETEEILKIEKARQAALAGGDMSALQSLMADDLLHIHANGRCQDKAEFVDYFSGMSRRVERGDLAVRIWGDTAVVTGPLTNITPQPDGSEKVVCLYATQVLRRDADGWKFVSFHASPLAAARQGSHSANS